MTTASLTTNCTIRTIRASAARIALAPSGREKIRGPADGPDLPRPSAVCTSLNRYLLRVPVRQKPPSSATDSALWSTCLAESAGDPSPVARGFLLGEEYSVQ